MSATHYGTGEAARAERRGLAGRLDNHFKISERGSSISAEVRGGVVMWMTMSYIIVVNPSILVHGGTVFNPMPFNGVATATCVCSAISCLLAGLWTNLPLGIVSGMGLNAYFAYGACRSLGIPWQVVLAGASLHGVIFLVLSWMGVCSQLQKIVPDSVKKGITVGIGLFQAFLGFQMMGVVVASPLTLVTLGNVYTPEVMLSFAGIFLIAVFMIVGVKGAMFFGIVVVTVVSWATGMSPPPQQYFSLPSLDGVLFAADFQGLWHHFNEMFGVIAAFLFVSIFDIAGVMYGICLSAGLLDEDKEVPHGGRAFAASAIGSIIGGLVGTSPLIIANETTAGVIEGARTGLSALVAAALFLASSVFTPLLAAVPPQASSVPLVIVGFFMFTPAKFIRWDHTYEALPAYLTVTIMTLTYSIANGCVAGLLAHSILTISVSLLQCLGVEISLEAPDEDTARENPDALPKRQGTTGAGTPMIDPRLTPLAPHRVLTPYQNQEYQRRHSFTHMPSPLARQGSSGGEMRCGSGEV